MHPESVPILLRPVVVRWSSAEEKEEVPVQPSGSMWSAADASSVFLFQRWATVGQVRMRCSAVAGACVPQCSQGRSVL